MRRVAAMAALLPLALAPGAPRLEALQAPHPPVAGFYREEDWLTVSDFRHVTAVAASIENAYVGTAGGVEVLSPFTGEVVGTVTAGDGLPTSVVTALAFEERSGKLWVGTALGLALYDPFRGEVVQDPLGLGPARIAEIRVAGGDRAGGPPDPGAAGSSLDAGLFGSERLYVLAGGEWLEADPLTLAARPADPRDLPPAEAADLDLRAIPFVAGDVLRGERSGRPESFRLTAAARLFNGRIVLGTWGANAWLHDPVRLSPEPVRHGLAAGGGGALGWDGERLWFSNAPASRRAWALGTTPAAAVADQSALASASADLRDWDHHYPGTEQSLPSDRVHDIAAAGRWILFATDAGLAVHDRESGTWHRVADPALQGAEVLAVEAVGEGAWAGTERGLLALGSEDGDRDGDGRRDEAEREEEDRAEPRDEAPLAPAGRWLEGRAVLALAADGRELYAGTDLGLYRLAPDPGDPAGWVLSEVRTVGREVRDLALLEGEVVVATDRGVELIPRGGGEPQLFLVGESQLDEPPLAVAADGAAVWVGTAQGVARWDRGRKLWTEYGLADGLPELPVLDVLLQDAGYVWFSTPGGATRFDLRAGGDRIGLAEPAGADGVGRAP